MSGQATPLPFTVCIVPGGVVAVSQSEAIRVVRVGGSIRVPRAALEEMLGTTLNPVKKQGEEPNANPGR